MNAKEWLDKNEWDNTPIDSSIFSHYTMLDTLMDEYAKEFLKERMKEIQESIRTNKFI